MRAVNAVYLGELTKLRFQARVWLVSGLVVIAPWVFILLLKGQDRLPTDSLYGRFLTSTGYATPLVVLGFLAQWGFPLLAALVAGDIFANEDQQGTIKTILTRSVSRWQVFVGKVLATFTWSIGVAALMAASSIAAGAAVIGTQPLISTAGTTISSHDALVLTIASWAVCLLPLLGFACLSMMVSVLSRNSVVGVMVPVVVGFFMGLYAFLNGQDVIRHNLLTTPFLAWHGLLDDPSFQAPLIRAVLVCGVYSIVSLGIAWTVFRRRDVTGG